LQITSQPQSTTVNDGSTASFSISASNATGYQWYGNDSLITGANNTTYSFTATTALNNSQIWCVVYNATDTIISDTATLTVTSIPMPTITNSADTLKLVCSATNATGYQWYQNSALLSGETDSVLIIIADSAFYSSKKVIYCMVSNGAGSVKSGEWTFQTSTTATGSRRDAYKSAFKSAYKRAWK
jgi:hypothetical protein